MVLDPAFLSSADDLSALLTGETASLRGAKTMPRTRRSLANAGGGGFHRYHVGTTGHRGQYEFDLYAAPHSSHHAYGGRFMESAIEPSPYIGNR